MNTLSASPSPIRLPQQWEWDIMTRYADAAVKSGMVAGTTRADQALFVILKGYELGITPIESLSNIHLIKGKPGLSVQLMISLANRSGMLSHLDMPDAAQAFKDKKAVVMACRKDRPDSPVTMTFSMEDAASAGLLSNPTWKQYPGQMLVNRAMSMVLRRIIPEALSGMYLAEELENSTSDARPEMTYTALPESAAVVPTLTAHASTGHWSDDPKMVSACYKWAGDTFGGKPDAVDAVLSEKRITLKDLTRDEFKGLMLASSSSFDAETIAKMGEAKSLSVDVIASAMMFVTTDDTDPFAEPADTLAS